MGYLLSDFLGRKPAKMVYDRPMMFRPRYLLAVLLVVCALLSFSALLSYSQEESQEERDATIQKQRQDLRLREEKYFRARAASVLGEIGAREALPDLLRALRSDLYPEVRHAAAKALGELNEKVAMPYLRQAFSSDVDIVRRPALEALVRLDAKEAVPDLLWALQFEVPSIRQYAAYALGHMEAKEAIPELKEALAKDSHPGVQAAAKEALVQLEAQPHLEKWILDNIEKILIFLCISLYVITVLLCYWLQPLCILKWHDLLRPVLNYKLKIQGYGETELELRPLLTLGLYHGEEVLDAWIADRVEKVRKEFWRLDTVEDRRVYVKQSVRIGSYSSKDVEKLQSEDLYEELGQRVCLIWGEGGAGKTSLACQIADWGLDKKLQRHAMLPILIETGFEVAEKSIEKALEDVIHGQLERSVGESIPADLLRSLLKKRRLLVIVDGLSEMRDTTRSGFRPERPDFPARALAVTSRHKEKFGCATIKLHPLRVEVRDLKFFIGEYLKQKREEDLKQNNKPVDFTDSEFDEACTQLARIVREPSTTTLLAKLFADQMISEKRTQGQLGDLPKSIPALILKYLDKLNQKHGERFENRHVHEVAKKVAWECVKDTYRPGEAHLDRLEELLTEKGDILRFLEHDLRILRRQPPSQTHVRFSLDPLAEYLAGLWFVETRGREEDQWKEFFETAEKIEDPKTIAGFLSATYDCCVGFGVSVPESVLEKLRERMNLILEELEQDRRPEAIDRFLGTIGDSDLPEETRKDAIKGLVALRAKEKVPELLKVFRCDEDAGVRRSIINALRKLRVKEAVPDLRKALHSDEDADVRELAAKALGGLGVEEAVSDLQRACRSDKDLKVRQSARIALRRLGAPPGV